MANFPNTIYTPRDTENLPGITFNPADKKNLYSEDFQGIGNELNAIETILGVNPQGIYATVKAWLTALAGQISNIIFVNSAVNGLVDSYDVSHFDSGWLLYNGGTTSDGQSFTPSITCVLDYIKVNMAKNLSATGLATASIYAHSGTYGVNSKPTGPALATSDTLDVSTLLHSWQLKTFTFTGANRIILNNNTHYVLTINYSGGDVNNSVYVGTDQSSPTASGNFCEYYTTWTAHSNIDMIYYVYGANEIPTVTVPANATISGVNTGDDKTAVNGILKGNGSVISAVVSGTDIKTVNGFSILGAGNISAGTVSTVSVIPNNGITATVDTPTTTPAITLGLGNITPSTVNALQLINPTPGDLIHSYDESHAGSGWSLNSAEPGIGQSFLCPFNTVLDKAIFYLEKTGFPTGLAYAKLYAHSGTYGVNSKPTGPALATSDTLDVSTLTGVYQLITFTFTAGNKISLTSGTYYVITISYAGGDVSNYVVVSTNGSSPTDPGNLSYTNNGTAWIGFDLNDTIFYIYGDSNVKTVTVPANATISGVNTGDQDLSGFMLKANNLSDVASVPNSRVNLGFPSAIGLAGNCLISNGSSYISVALASYQGSPANPAGISSVPGLMCGLAGSILPTGIGKVLLLIEGNCYCSSNSIVGSLGLRYGTGTAPTNGNALTGFAVGRILNNKFGNVSGLPFALHTVITGLAIGTTYWLDMTISSPTGTVYLTDLSVSCVEL